MYILSHRNMQDKEWRRYIGIYTTKGSCKRKLVKERQRVNYKRSWTIKKGIETVRSQNKQWSSWHGQPGHQAESCLIAQLSGIQIMTMIWNISLKKGHNICKSEKRQKSFPLTLITRTKELQKTDIYHERIPQFLFLFQNV